MATTAGPATSPATSTADEPWADELGTALVRLVKLVERTAAQIGSARGDGLERAAWGVLFRVHVEGPQRSSAVAEALHTDPSTVSRHVTQLVELGYLRRTADPADGRATLLATTEEGDAQCRAARQRRNRAVGHVLADWPHADRAALVGLLEKFTTQLDPAHLQLAAAAAGTPTQGES